MVGLIWNKIWPDQCSYVTRPSPLQSLHVHYIVETHFMCNLISTKLAVQVHVHVRTCMYVIMDHYYYDYFTCIYAKKLFITVFLKTIVSLCVK